MYEKYSEAVNNVRVNESNLYAYANDLSRIDVGLVIGRNPILYHHPENIREYEHFRYKFD